MSGKQGGAAGMRALMVALLLSAVWAGPAFGGTTPVLGNVTGQAASSLCADGSFVDALSVTLDPRGPYVETVTVRCVDASGATSFGALIGELFWYEGGGLSQCAAGDVATGFLGRAGDIVDAVGVVCAGDDGALVGGGGGVAQSLDCPAGERLIGLDGTYVNYFGAPTVSSLQGRCVALRAASVDECKDDGWRNYGGRYRNQGDCVSSVVSNRRDD